MLSQVSPPPLLFGTTWSIVSFLVEPQYWHLLWSRAYIMALEGFEIRILEIGSLINSTSRMTLSEMIAAFSLRRRTIALFHEVMWIGSYEALSTST